MIALAAAGALALGAALLPAALMPLLAVGVTLAGLRVAAHPLAPWAGAGLLLGGAAALAFAAAPGALAAALAAGAGGAVALGRWASGSATQEAALAADLDRARRRVRYLLTTRDEVMALTVHDLQSPIQAIRGIQSTAVHVLGDPKLDRTALRAALQSASDTCDELSRRVGSLLSEARAHRAEAAGTVPLAPLVREVAAMHGLVGESRGVRIEQAVPAQMRVRDPDEVRDVLDVLLDNALRAAPAGGIARIEAHRSGGRIALTVADSGEGIPPARRARLFEPGAAGPGGRRGMGLHLSRRRARSIGAELTYDPPSDGGARFVLSLPAA